MLHAPTRFDAIIESAYAPEARLPDAPPLTLTRNFVWVVFICIVSLITVPLVVAWTAGMLLT